MTHELQNEFALALALKLLPCPGRSAGRGFARPGGMFGKHGLGAARQLSGVAFGDFRAKIIGIIPSAYCQYVIDKTEAVSDDSIAWAVLKKTNHKKRVIRGILSKYGEGNGRL